MNETKFTLLNALSQEFAADVGAISIIQIGSSVFQPTARDIDLLVIDRINTGSPSSEALNHLRTCFGHGTPAIGAFDPSSEPLKSRVLRVVRSIPLSGDLNIKVSFVMGPAESELNLGPNDLHLHVCGEFTHDDMRECAILLPYHVLGFLQQNKCIMGTELSQLCPKPRPDALELRFWIDRLHQLAKTTHMKPLKRKFISRMLLCFHLHNGHQAAYQAVARALEKLGVFGSASSETLDDLADEVRLSLIATGSDR